MAQNMQTIQGQQYWVRGWASGILRATASVMLVAHLMIVLAVLTVDTKIAVSEGDPFVPAYSFTEDTMVFVSVISELIALLLLSTTHVCCVGQGGCTRASARALRKRDAGSHRGSDDSENEQLISLAREGEGEGDGDGDGEGGGGGGDGGGVRTRDNWPAIIISALSLVAFLIGGILITVALTKDECVNIPACKNASAGSSWVVVVLIMQAFILVCISTLVAVELFAPTLRGTYPTSDRHIFFQALATVAAALCLASAFLLYCYTSLLITAGLEVTADFWTFSLFILVPMVQFFMFLFLGLSPVIHWLTKGRLMPAWVLYLFAVIYVALFLGVTFYFSQDENKCPAPADYTFAWCKNEHFTEYCTVLIVATISDICMGGILYAMQLYNKN
jgi:hypothetical protein